MLGTTKLLIRSLEDANRDLRADYCQRLEDKDILIVELRERIFQLESENRKMLLVLLPYGTTAGGQLAREMTAKKTPLPIVGEGVADYQTELRSGVEAEIDV